MRIRSKAPAYVMTASILLAGCSTELVSEQVVPGSGIQAGMTYHLPMTRHELTLTRQVRECPTPGGSVKTSPSADDPGNSDQTLPAAPESWVTLKIDYASEVAVTTVPDPLHIYRIDYEALRAWNKTSEMTIKTNPDGTLAEFNASADDKSAEIATNVIGTVGQIAMTAAGVPGVQIAFERDKTKEELVIDILSKLLVCKDGVEDALAKLEKSAPELKERQTAVSSAAGDVARSRLIHVEAPTDASATQLRQDIEALEATQQSLQALVQARQTYVDRIRDVRTVVLDTLGPSERDGSESARQTVSDGTKLRERWLTRLNQDEGQQANGGEGTEQSRYRKWKAALGTLGETELELVLAALDADGNQDAYANLLAVDARFDLRGGGTITEPNAPFAPADGESTGLYYRVPAPVRFVVTCRGSCGTGGSNPNVIQAEESRALQYGARMVLPFGNGTFESNELRVVFGNNGVPNELTYKELQAAGVQASGVAAEAADELRARLDEREQRGRRETQLETLDTQAKAELAEAELRLAEARDALAARTSDE